MVNFIKKNLKWFRIGTIASFIIGTVLVLISCFSKLDGKTFKGSAVFDSYEVLSTLGYTKEDIEEEGYKDKYDIEYTFEFNNGKVTITTESELVTFLDDEAESDVAIFAKDVEYKMDGNDIIIYDDITIAKKAGPFVGTYDLQSYAVSLTQVENIVVMVNAGNLAMLIIGAILVLASLTAEGFVCYSKYIKKD